MRSIGRRLNVFALWATVLWLQLAGISGEVQAQCNDCLHVDYESTLGLPTTQCWTLLSTGTGAAVLNAAGLVITSSSSIYAYESARPPFRWADGCFMEARLRVPVASYTMLPGLRSPLFGGADAVGVGLHVWIWATGVALSTDANANAGPGLAVMGFDAASTEHTYRLESDAIGAKLYIDGILRLQLPYTNTTPTWRNLINFGNDSRTSGLAITEWRYVRFGTITAPADVIACGSGNAVFMAAAQGTSPTFQWQWSASTAGPWSNVVHGPNIDSSSGVMLFDANGEQSSTLSLDRFSAVGNARFYFRCFIASSCGNTHSELAALDICRPDYDCNGIVDVLDMLGFIDDFGICEGQPLPCGTQEPDVNGDTVVDVLDFLDFLDAFSQGC